MHSTPAPQHPPTTAPRAWSMGDVWGSYPDPTGGSVADAVARQVAAHAPLAATSVGAAPMAGADPANPHLRPYREPAAWLALKHGVQLALVASVVIFVLQGGQAPLLAVGHVATALLMVLVVVVADRTRFADHDPGLAIVEVVAADAAVHHADVHSHGHSPATHAPHHPASVHQGALTPLVHQMQVVLQQRVDVT